MDATAHDEFLAKAQEVIDRLIKEEAALAAQEEGVRRRRSALQADIADWKRATELYSGAMGLIDPDDPLIEAALEPAAASVTELASKYLWDRGGQARIADVVKWLVAIGKLPAGGEKANQNYGAVYTAMLRNPQRFSKVGPGEFALVSEGVREE